VEAVRIDFGAISSAVFWREAKKPLGGNILDHHVVPNIRQHKSFLAGFMGTSTLIPGVMNGFYTLIPNTIPYLSY
jgi:hypothetical protein